MLTKWLITSGLGLMVGVFAAGTSLVLQGTAGARPLDNPEDVQKGEKPNKDGQGKPVEGKIISGNRARQWREKLDQTTTIEFEPNTPLREAVSHLADHFKMTILVDKETFKEANSPEIESQPIQLSRLADVKLLTVLRAIFQQVGGDFYTKDYVLTVVPRGYIETGRIFKHPVDVSFSKRPLAEALTELSDLSGVSVVLDPRGQADGNLVVTADFRNVPVQDAVRVLANMADMKSVVMDNLLYVTSIQNADNLEEEKAQKRGDAPAKWEKVMPQEKK
jgi:hypothetical protein